MLWTQVDHSWNDELLKMQAPSRKIACSFSLEVQCALG